MPRQCEVPKRERSRSALHRSSDRRSKLVTKFMNTLMYGGKKATAEGILYGAFDVIERALQGGAARGLPQGARQRQAEARSEEPPRRRRDLPGSRRGSPRAPRRPRRCAGWSPTRATAARRRCASASRPSSSTPSNNRGNAVKKKEDTHKMAEANKAFAHYRW